MTSGGPVSPTIESIISDLPSGVRDAIRAGIGLTDKLTPSRRSSVINLVIAEFNSGGATVDLPSISESAEVPLSDMRRIGAAISLFISILSQSDCDLDSFVSAAKGIVFSEENEAAAREIAQEIILKREHIGETLSQHSLANETLPSFYSIHTSVDIRLKFVSNAVVGAVPVALARIETDVDTGSLSFQMSKSDITRIIKELQEANDKMDTAKDLLSRLQQT